uniref:Uncharacterized protein n=1 Tax=Arundo donax TaxID=35708 RepID=A0A0A9BPA6_ARUDO
MPTCHGRLNFRIWSRNERWGSCHSFLILDTLPNYVQLLHISQIEAKIAANQRANKWKTRETCEKNLLLCS